MGGKFCTLRESKEFGKQAKKIADIKYVDAALAILTVSISHNPSPEAFPFVPGYGNIQIAKTDSYTKEGVTVSPLRLWFRKVDENITELLAIEEYEKEND